MSKGHGRVMRQILAHVTDEWRPVVHLAADIEGLDRAERPSEEATRRACKRLAAQGLVELAYQAMKTGRIRPLSKPDGQRARLVVRRA